MTAKEYFEAGKKMDKEGNWEEAIRYYDKAIQINPNYIGLPQKRDHLPQNVDNH